MKNLIYLFICIIFIYEIQGMYNFTERSASDLGKNTANVDSLHNEIAFAAIPIIPISIYAFYLNYRKSKCIEELWLQQSDKLDEINHNLNYISENDNLTLKNKFKNLIELAQEQNNI